MENLRLQSLKSNSYVETSYTCKSLSWAFDPSLTLLEESMEPGILSVTILDLFLCSLKEINKRRIRFQEIASTICIQIKIRIKTKTETETKISKSKSKSPGEGRGVNSVWSLPMIKNKTKIKIITKIQIKIKSECGGGTKLF